MPNENAGKTPEQILADAQKTIQDGKGAPPAPASAGGGAPSVIGKALYEDDLRAAEFLGVKGFKNLFGMRVDENQKDAPAVLPLNFGRKSQTLGMPEDARLRLFNLKKLIHSLQIQSEAAFRGQFVTPDMMKTMPIFKDHLAPLLKAYNVTDFANWIPDIWARFYFEEYELPFLLADLFDYQPMDSATMEVPGDTGHLEGTEETDTATFASQSTTTANYTVASRNNVVHTKITQDMMSDSAPAYIDKLRRDLMKGTIRSYERGLINGDTTKTAVRGDAHQDVDTRALALNATFLKAFDGMRSKAFANETLIGVPGSVVYDHGGDTASKIMFEKLLNMLGKFGSEKDDLAYILPSCVENQLVTGAIPELFTAFAFGGLASNVTGTVPPVFGIRPITSGYVRDDLAATGKYAAPGATTTSVLLVKKSRFLNFVRQATRMWAAPSLPSSDELLMTSKTRHTWNGNPQTAKEIGIVMAINVARS